MFKKSSYITNVKLRVVIFDPSIFGQHLPILTILTINIIAIYLI